MTISERNVIITHTSSLARPLSIHFRVFMATF
jgi:hypothetical protein